MDKESRRADKVETEQRVRAVYQALMDGWESTQLVQSLSVKWGISIRQGWNYVRKANTRIKRESERIEKEAFGRHLTTRRGLYKKAVEREDIRLGLDILKDEAKLLDLYPADKQKVEHTGKIESLTKIVVREYLVDESD